ncbi:cationic outer membrane protein OmpH [Blattabacterium sp. (Blattella germanica) str. Bge]|uniref:OmpH family outer membrane protein n=1 Tax=Blattabacterium sp. (Blattella germanica) TaxID=624186 RepID=UPI0001BB60B0|nr:OmpH family outer membrane protein [Blattabacterium sp. (Blattella germanica)]ACY40122.1 cationic outer membrane protein OmpH [Blattabacterium sp. (Blattella germanica) str. Bge]
MGKNTIFYFLLFFLLFGYSYSYSHTKVCQQRIVCLNSMVIIEKMPEFSSAQKELDRISKMHENILDKLAKEFHKKAEKFQKNKNPILKKELEILQARAHAYQKTAADDLTKKQNKLLNPIYKKIENAIHKVIEKDKSIIRVDDCSPGKGVLVNKGKDITEEVKKELGI